MQRDRDGPESEGICSHCGADLPPRALSCKECGSDSETGWADSEEIGYAAALGEIPDHLPEDLEAQERQPARSGARRRLGVLVAALVLAAFLAVVVGDLRLGWKLAAVVIAVALAVSTRLTPAALAQDPAVRA